MGVLLPTLGLFVADLAFLTTLVMLAVAGFRIRAFWGVVLLLAPLGGVFFCIKHWDVGGKLYLLKVASYVAMVAILLAYPEFFREYGRFIPYSSRIADVIEKAEKANPSEKSAPGDAGPSPADPSPAASRTAVAVPADPHAAQRAALARHTAELNALYAELNGVRAKLKKGSPEVAAFNARAAKYQAGLAALAGEQAQLDALDHPTAATASLAQPAPVSSAVNPKEAEANAALARLRAAAAAADYAGFAGTLKTCLADYRGTAAFPQIVATARGTLENTTPDRLAAAVEAQGAAARAERDAAMGKVRGIVNQTPPVAPRPPRNAEVYHYGYHPGALTPDFAHADLYSTRELWKGDYVYMDTVPNVFYRSADCEFNPQTKFFFTSRDVPKKKLTDLEVAEVVRLYRLIAADERMIAAQPQRLQEARAASADLLALNKQLAASR